MKILLIPICWFIILAGTVLPVYGQLQSKTPDNQTQKVIDEYIDKIKEYKVSRNHLELAKYYNKLGFLYWELNSTKEAVLFFSKSIQVNEEMGNQNAIKNLLSNLGMIYFDATEWDNALMYFNKSLKINEKLAKNEDICADLVNIAMTYQGMGDYEKSNEKLHKALSIAQEVNSMPLIKNCFSMLAENYDALGNSKKSLEYYDKYSALQAALQKKEVTALKARSETAEARISYKEQQLKSTVDTLYEVIQEKAEIELLRQREKEIAEMKIAEEKRIRAEEKKQNRMIFGFLAGIALLSILFIVVVLIQIRQKKKANQLLSQKNQEVEKKNKEIEKQRDIAHKQREKLMDSIHYAQRIQSAVLPPEQQINELLDDYFLYFKPRDIVSGDFYWLTRKENILILVAADCTGHGVPGAFMSMLGVAFLNEIVNKIAINKHISSLQANEILNQLREQVINSLHQRESGNQNKDGMDLALCIIDYEQKQVQFSGAHNPLYIIRNKELLQFKGDKMPVGMHRNAEKPFTNHTIELQDNDLLYIFSDGFPDQFGGEHGEKFLTKRFKELLVEMHQKPLNEQKDILEDTLENWKGERDQLDDILVIGIKFTSKVKKTAPPSDRNWSDKRILIVEDTDVNYFLLAEALKPTGIQILRAKNGKEAVDFCETNETDLILMDINMPVMNGNKATKIIKSFRKNLPIIAQTAQNADGEKEKSQAAGCDDYISKPIDLKSFLNVIERHLFL